MAFILFKTKKPAHFTHKNKHSRVRDLFPFRFRPVSPVSKSICASGFSPELAFIYSSTVPRCPGGLGRGLRDDRHGSRLQVWPQFDLLLFYVR